MNKLYLNANKKLEFRKVIEVVQLENDQDYEFIMAKGRWHSHDNFKTFCPSDECIVMAVF